MVSFDKPIKGKREDVRSTDKYGNAVYSYYTMDEKRLQKIGYLEAVKRIVEFKEDLNPSVDTAQILTSLQEYVYNRINEV